MHNSLRNTPKPCPCLSAADCSRLPRFGVALALSSGRNTKMLAALALARAGDVSQARTLATELQRDNPRRTLSFLQRISRGYRTRPKIWEIYREGARGVQNTSS